MFALIDCNNFYASCERLFRPDLHHRPIVVLSSNDGCVIARSNEAKDLGILMGEPYFKVKNLCRRHQVQVFSSNFTLYGDLSRRVMATIEQACPNLEIYSIDEAFIDLRHLSEDPATFCMTLQKTILKNTGIPTSIGLGTTKTLAKVANHICKKILKSPFFYLHQEEWLKEVAIGEVWGIGKSWARKLLALDITTAYELSKANPQQLKNQFNVVLMRLALELRGIICGNLIKVEGKKSILSSKSFGAMQTEYAVVAEALSSHCARAVEKLRQQNALIQRLSIFVYTNRFRTDLAQHVQSVEIYFPYPTDDLRLITQKAKEGLFTIFKPGYHYKKTGVCLAELLVKSTQMSLFHPLSEQEMQKTEQLMSVFERINQKFGRRAICLAAEGTSRTWDALWQMGSPRYTTSWAELPVVKTGS